MRPDTGTSVSGDSFDGTVIESGSDRYVSCDSGADENGNDTDFAGTYF